VFWYLRRIEGWDGPDVRIDNVELPLRHGERVTNSLYGARALELRGSIAGWHRSLVREAWQHLLFVTNGLENQEILVVHEDQPKAVLFQRAGKPRGAWADRVWEFEIPLVARDPRKYGVPGKEYLIGPYGAGTESLEIPFEFTVGSGADLAVDFAGASGGGDVVVRNEGNFWTFPRFYITGPTTGSMTEFSVKNMTTDEEATFIVTLTDTEQLYVNMFCMGTGRRAPAPIQLDGTPRFSAWQTPRDLISLRPGDNAIRFEVLAGDTVGATLRLAMIDAWI
jgi:hypothetical protein